MIIEFIYQFKTSELQPFIYFQVKCNSDIETDELRKRLMQFGDTIKNLQHYCYHTKIVGLTKLLGKLLTRIWWIYHNTSLDLY